MLGESGRNGVDILTDITTASISGISSMLQGGSREVQILRLRLPDDKVKRLLTREPLRTNKLTRTAAIAEDRVK
jgi:hypothetical protein